MICRRCQKEPVPEWNAARRIYYCRPCNNARNREAQAKYRKTEKNRTVQARFRRTDKCKAAQARYANTDKGFAARVRSNAKRILLGRRTIGRAQTAELAAAINEHIRQRVAEYTSTRERYVPQ